MIRRFILKLDAYKQTCKGADPGEECRGCTPLLEMRDLQSNMALLLSIFSSRVPNISSAPLPKQILGGAPLHEKIPGSIPGTFVVKIHE